MLERSDGLIFNFRENSKTGDVEIHVLSTRTGAKAKHCLVFHELERMFSHNFDLMNPNKTAERYAWMAERIQFDGVAAGSGLKFVGDPVCSLVDVMNVTKFKLPLVNMSASERSELVNVDRRRADKIAALEKLRSERFMADLKRASEELSHKQQEAAALVDESIAQCHREKQLHAEMQQQQNARRTALDARRGSKLKEKAFLRSVQDERYAEKLAKEKDEQRHEREIKINACKSQREEMLKKTKEEQVQFYQDMKRLESARQREHEMKEKRWYARENERLKEIANKEIAAERTEIIIQEKRKARAFELFASQQINV